VISVFDNFLEDPEAVRQSAISAGFGTWTPTTKGIQGLTAYSGVGFWGKHEDCYKALYKKIGQFIPSSHFFRVTNPGMERAIIHSDREYGDFTAIVYLSHTTDVGSGTGFYKHRETGWIDMPPMEQRLKDPVQFEKMKEQMHEASDEHWHMYKFVEGKFNRCVVFDAPKIHCRLPKNGYGKNEQDSRMVWVTHFNGIR